MSSSFLLRESALPPNPDVLSTLFTLGNGRFAVRGTFSHESGETEGAGMPGPNPPFRGVYVSGLYTKAGYGLQYFMAGPDWLPAFLEGRDGRLWPENASRLLDMQRGLLQVETRYRDYGVDIRVTEDRFLSFASPHTAVQRFRVRIEKLTTEIRLALGLEGEVYNHRAKYFQPGQLPNCTAKGLRLSEVEALEAEPCLHVRLFSEAGGVRASCRARVRQIGPWEAEGLSFGGAAGDTERPKESAAPGIALKGQSRISGARAETVFALPQVEEGGKPVDLFFEKVIVLTADLRLSGGGEFFERAEPDNEKALARLLARESAAAPLSAPLSDILLREHVAALDAFWREAEVEIGGDPEAETAVRYALWQTRASAPRDGGASSLGAKNLTGDWYRGAVFWDMEMFQLPLLCAVAPAEAKNHLLYRYNRLPAGRILARQDGYRGARFPWQSYGTGLEDPPVIGGFLYQQQHLNAAVAHGVLQYFAATHDTETLLTVGLPLLADLAAYWESRLRGPDEKGFYHIEKVCGPDEIHQGVNDNAYTNQMVAALFASFAPLLDRLRGEGGPGGDSLADTLRDLGLDEDRLKRYARLAGRIHLPGLGGDPAFGAGGLFARFAGIPAQFEGFSAYPEPDEKILAARGHGADKTCKQADTLLAFQALPHSFSPDLLQKCYDFYAPLCNQTSSLSLCTHALLAARLGYERDALRYFASAMGVDLADTLGNSCHGIHGAGEGGVWLAAVQGFGGLSMSLEACSLEPRLPSRWSGITYRARYRGHPFTVSVERGRVTVRSRAGAETASPIALRIDGRDHRLEPGGSLTAEIDTALKPQALAAVLFDLDGVLVTTDHYHFLAWKELADSLGLSFDEKVNHRLRGISREESLRIIYRHNGKEPPEGADLEAQCTRKNERYVALLDSLTPAAVLPGALDLLQALQREKIRIGIASSSKNAPKVLEKTGLAPYIDAISDGRNITASKPDPQVFYLGAQRLRALPWNCVGVEDAEMGVESIRGCGMLSIGIGSEAKKADLWVESTLELTVEKIRALFEAKENPLDPYTERNVHKMKAEMG